MQESGSFGQWLRRRRRALDLTQAELAFRAGCAPITIKKLEAGQLRPSKQLAEVVVRRLGAGPHEIESLVRLARANRPPPESALCVPLPSPVDPVPRIDRPAFFSRQNELARLHGFLDRTLKCQGQVVSITGEPGQGKTALAREFAWQSQERHPKLIVSAGNCNAFAGGGDPYLPFRQILGILSGDFEAGWATGRISKEEARRVWAVLPFTVSALVDYGPDLIGVFVSGEDLIQRASALDMWPERDQQVLRLETLVHQREMAAVGHDLPPAAIMDQYTRVVRELSRRVPLLLILDDLQWADNGSLDLLFSVGAGAEDAQLMVLCACRPTEVEVKRDTEHPSLGSIFDEFKQRFGDTQVNLDAADGRRFIDDIIDSEPNRLGEGFRARLFGVCDGHPLATIEILREMRAGGGMVRDAAGQWIEGPSLNWEIVPPRLEGMIAGRTNRLATAEREVLKVASVEGETFTGEVVARVLDMDPAAAVAILSGKLSQRHCLVEPQGVRHVDGQRLSTFRFRHNLFQRYLYSVLDPVERPHLHEAVATALQDLYGAAIGTIAVQLARHFQEAGLASKAGEYLTRAGDRASELVAPREAIDHYQEAMLAYGRAFGDHWAPLQRAILERKIGEALYLQGRHQQALDRYLRALGYLGVPIPRLPSGVMLHIFGGIIRQAGHKILPRIFLKGVPEPISQEFEERQRIFDGLMWITALIDGKRFLMHTLYALNDSERSGFLPRVANRSATLGVVADMAGLLGVGEYYHRRAGELTRQLEDSGPLAAAYNMMALQRNIRGDWIGALGHARHAAKAYQSSWNLHGWAWAVTSMADANIHQGDFHSALAHGKEVVRFGKERSDEQALCWGLARQGYALRGLGQLAEAAESLERAMAVARGIPDFQTSVDAGGELGHCYLRQGNMDRAMNVYAECQRQIEEHNLLQSPSLTRFRNGHLEAYLEIAEHSALAERGEWLQKAARAAKVAQKQGKAYRPGLSETHMLQGRLEWLSGKPATARRRWQQSLALADELEERFDQGAVHLAMGIYLNSRNELEQAAKIFRDIGAAWELARAQKGLTELQ